MYIYQKPKWPAFTWNQDKVSKLVRACRFEQGRLLGKMSNLGFELQEEATVEAMTSEVVKSSEIEGEVLNSDEVRSSIARHLGIEIVGLLPSDRHVDGIVEMLLDAIRHYKKPLTEQRLCHWHALLFPSGLSGMMLVKPGIWRSDTEGPMQVISGHYGKEKVHFQAPPAKQLLKEIKKFIKWFNQSSDTDPLIKSAITHLWFVTLHPFEDGNGRISRALTDMALAQAENTSQRFYSMSTQIRKQRKSYYDILEKTQKGSLDITEWLLWFLDCLQKAITQSSSLLQYVLNKSEFWREHEKTPFNARQIAMLNVLFDGFKGKLSSSKWAKMMKCSQDTASRDINQLIEFDILVKSPEGGRSTNYLLKNYSIRQI